MTPDEQCGEAQTLLNTGQDYRTAVLLFNDALSRDGFVPGSVPDDPHHRALAYRALMGAANALHSRRKGDWPDALAYAQLAVECAASDEERANATECCAELMIKLNDCVGARGLMPSTPERTAQINAKIEIRLINEARVKKSSIGDAMRDGPQSPVKYINSATQQLDALRAELDNSPVGDITCADVESIELTDDMGTKMQNVVKNAGRLCQILRPRDECAARHAVERVSIRLDSAKPRVVMGSWNLRFYSEFHSMGKMKVKAEHVVNLLSRDNVHLLALQEGPGASTDFNSGRAMYRSFDDFKTALGEEIDKVNRDLGRRFRFEAVLTGGESAVFVWDDVAYSLQRIGRVDGTTGSDGGLTCNLVDSNVELEKALWASWTNGDTTVTEGWIKRPPCFLILKHLTTGSYLGMLSAHLKAKAPDNSLDQTRNEARLLSHAAECVAANVEALGGGAVMVAGDFNLGPPGDLREGSAPRVAWQRLSECGFRWLVDSGGGTVSSNIDELCKSGGHLYDNIWIKTTGSDSSFGDGARATGRVHEPPDARIALDDFKHVEHAARSAVTGDFCTAFLHGRMQSAFQKDFVAHWSDHWPVIGELPFGDAPAAAPPNEVPLLQVDRLADDLRHLRTRA